MTKAKKTWLDNQTELGAALGCTPQTIRTLIRQYGDKAPKPRPDGKWPLEPWQELWDEHKGIDTAAPVDRAADDTLNEQPGVASLHELKCRETLINCMTKELAYAERSGKLVDPTEAIQSFGMACAAINTGFENLIKRCEPKMVGLKDPQEVSEILREEVAILVSNLRQWTAPEEEVPE